MSTEADTIVWRVRVLVALGTLVLFGVIAAFGKRRDWSARTFAIVGLIFSVALLGIGTGWNSATSLAWNVAAGLNLGGMVIGTVFSLVAVRSGLWWGAWLFVLLAALWLMFFVFLSAGGLPRVI